MAGKEGRRARQTEMIETEIPDRGKGLTECHQGRHGANDGARHDVVPVVN